MSKFKEANKKIEEGVVSGYKKIEKGTIEGYKKIENGVVSGYKKIEDKFVDKFLRKDNETIEETKERLKKEQEELAKKNEKGNFIRNYLWNYWRINICYWNVYVLNSRMEYVYYRSNCYNNRICYIIVYYTNI